MNPNPAFDSSIPVLTEIVLEPLPLAPEPTEPAPRQEAAAEAPPALPPEASPPVQAETPPAAAEPDWDALEHRIAERVLAQLQPQIDAVVRNALASASDQIHIGLRQAVEQIVAQQVAAVQFGQK